MLTRRRAVVLRGGPSNGCQLMAEVNPATHTIDSVNYTGFTYRDSGHVFHGQRIYDWLPVSVGPAGFEPTTPAV
jgi:hypothetical protein